MRLRTAARPSSSASSSKKAQKGAQRSNGQSNKPRLRGAGFRSPILSSPRFESQMKDMRQQRPAKPSETVAVSKYVMELRDSKELFDLKRQIKKASATVSLEEVGKIRQFSTLANPSSTSHSSSRLSSSSSKLPFFCASSSPSSRSPSLSSSTGFAAVLFISSRSYSTPTIPQYTPVDQTPQLPQHTSPYQQYQQANQPAAAPQQYDPAANFSAPGQSQADFASPLSANDHFTSSAFPIPPQATPVPDPTKVDITSALSDGKVDISQAITFNYEPEKISPVLDFLDKITPASYIGDLIIWLQHTSGLPWWQVILLSGFGLRVLLFPLFVWATKNQVKMSSVQPDLLKLQKKLMGAPVGGFAFNASKQAQYREESKKLMAEKGISMKKVIIPGLLQIPFYVSFFLGVRSIVWREPSLTTGGILWFTDLTSPDGWARLALISAFGFLAASELQREMLTYQQTSPILIWFTRAACFFIVPITLFLPQLIPLAWVSGAWAQVAQLLLISIPWVRRSLGIGAVTKEQKDLLAKKDPILTANTNQNKFPWPTQQPASATPVIPTAAGKIPTTITIASTPQRPPKK